jgi:hypothetical protein
MFGSAVIVVVGVVGFVATTPGSDKSEAGKQIAVPTLVSLTSTGATEVGPALGARCPWPFKAVLISGGVHGPWQSIVTDPMCTNGTGEPPRLIRQAARLPASSRSAPAGTGSLRGGVQCALFPGRGEGEVGEGAGGADDGVVAGWQGFVDVGVGVHAGVVDLVFDGAAAELFVVDGGAEFAAAAFGG